MPQETAVEEVQENAATEAQGEEQQESVWLNFHESFVNERTRKSDGSKFFSVSIPGGTTVNGVDVSGFEFNPLFVHKSKMNEHMRGVPMLPDKEIWLKKSVTDENGAYVTNPDGTAAKEVVKVMPADLRDALKEGRASYLASRAKGKGKTPAQDMESARSAAEQAPKKTQQTTAPAPCK